jgi:outer membrane protein assembly factor BamB
LACVDASSGEEIWAVNILDRFQAENITWGLSECLLVDGPNVIVTPGGGEALMAALDQRTGETVWTTEPLAEDRASYSSPILFRYGGRRIIANCSSAHGFGVDADTGTLLWTVPLRNPHGANIAGPIYGHGSVFYGTARTEDSRLYRLSVSGDGIAAEHLWTTPVDPVTGYAVLVDDTLFAARYLEEKWWFGLDWSTGRTKYELKDLTTGAAIYADERLYILDEQGAVALVKPHADGLTIAGQFRLTGERIRDAWAHPVLHDGRLYLRYHDTLWCYDVRHRSK